MQIFGTVNQQVYTGITPKPSADRVPVDRGVKMASCWKTRTSAEQQSSSLTGTIEVGTTG